MESAPLWRRLIARVLDIVFALGLSFVLILPIGLTTYIIYSVTSLFERDPMTAFTAAACYFVAYIGLEFFLLLRRDGQTLGKGLMGLRVVRAGGSAPLGAAQAFVRLVVLFTPFVLFSAAGGAPDSVTLGALSSLGGVVLVVSLVLAAVPRLKRRAVHDYVGGEPGGAGTAARHLVPAGRPDVDPRENRHEETTLTGFVLSSRFATAGTGQSSLPASSPSPT